MNDAISRDRHELERLEEERLAPWAVRSTEAARRRCDIVCEGERWLERKADEGAAYRAYLEHWGDWVNPWLEAAQATA